MRLTLTALVAVLLFGSLPAPSAGAQDNGVQLDVMKITPSVVAGDSHGEVTVTGKLTNTGPRTINDVEARIQRGNPVTTEPAVQRAMNEGSVGTVEPGFNPVTGRLAPGQQIPVQIRIPLTGPGSLQISQPGIYPLLINVNGVAGGRARLADARFLLPVLSVPGSPPARPAQPSPASTLVPISDYPRLEREALPGSPAVLVDDELATSLAPGGRLYDLVQAVAESAPAGSPLGGSLCFAVDPDLLITASAMRGGYQVRHPDTTLTDGIGRAAADAWLTKFRETAAGRCVIALPYADADIVALGRAGLPDLVRGALDGTDLVRGLLQVEPRNVLWPIDGALAAPVPAGLPRTVLLEPGSLNIPAGSLSPVRLRGTQLAAVPIDPLLTSGLDPLHDTPQRTTAMSPPQDGSLSVHNALAAMVFRSTQGQIGGATSVLVPPRRWNLTGEDLRSLLGGMQRLVDSGLVRPTALSDVDPSMLPEADLNYPVQASSAEISQPVLSELAAQNFKVGDLARSSERDPASSVQPGNVTTPLRNGLLRGASSAWRGHPDVAREWVDRGTGPIDDVLKQVHIEEFPGRTTRWASDSPIPVTVVNDLPITVGIVFHIPPVPGVQVQHDFGGRVATVPAYGRRQFWLQTDAHRAGRFTVDVTITAENGTRLGDTKRLQVESTNYGVFTPLLTGVAAALLVLMSVRRIVTRFRNRRARNAAAQVAANPPEAPAGGSGHTGAGTAGTNGEPRPESTGTARISTTEGDRDRS